MAKNDGPIAPTPEARARRLAEMFFPKNGPKNAARPGNEVKALHAATLIAQEIREALEMDRWERIQAEAWICRACDLVQPREAFVHRGLAELCPRCGLPAAPAGAKPTTTI